MKLEMEEQSPYWKERARVSNKKLVLFFRQLATLVGSGVPIMDSLGLTVEHDDDSSLPLVASRMQSQLAAGYTLSQASAEFPRVFAPLVVAFIRIGEENGSLVRQLEQMADWMERDQKLKGKVVAALVYPLCALALTVVLTLFLFIAVLPGFLEMFEEMEIELPLPTRILATLTAGISEPLIWAGGVFVLTSAMFAVRSFLETPSGRLSLYRLLLRTPVVGNLLRYAAVARFSYAMAAMVRSGCNFLLALRLATGVSGSPALHARMDSMLSSVSEGEPLADFMHENSEIFPKVAANLVAVAEESARLPKIFNLLAGHFEEMVEHQVEIMATLLEPILMSTVALVVGFVVVSVFLPMYGFLDKL